MNDEEILEELKRYCNYDVLRGFNKGKFQMTTNNHKMIINETIKIIEKQAKEIEELKADRDKYKKAFIKRMEYTNELEKDLFENCENYVINKKTIRNKIEHLKEQLCTADDENYMYREIDVKNIIIRAYKKLLESEEN